MDHLVYIAASGAREALLAQAANSHNLANASSAGFRADLVMARSAQLHGDRAESRAYAGMHSAGVDFSHGVVNVTGGALDVAINGDGWIAVEDRGGAQGLSRRGDLRVDELGQLLDGAGRKILGNSGPIALPPFSEVEIGSDGTVSIIPLGEDATTLSIVDRIKLVDPDRAQLEKGGNGLIQVKNGEALQADAAVTLIPGSLEASNVVSVDSMVQMIELARGFEQKVELMKTAEQLDQSSAELMRLN